MANNLNLCQFIGNLGGDPEQRFMPNGNPVATINMAINWKSKDKEGTEWVRVVAFDKLAEIMNSYLRKGSKVYIAGRMRTRRYEQDGITKYATEIIADRMEMLDSRQDSGGGQQSSGQSRSPGPAQQGSPYGAQQQSPPADFDNFDDDIPF